MSDPTRPLHLVAGDPRHAVTHYARQVAERCGAAVAETLPDRRPGVAAEPMHLHFTDRPWADDPAAAALLVEGLAARGPLSVTLHDLPQASDGPRNHERRADCYRRVVRVSRGVVCNSRHEAALLGDVLGAGRGHAPVIIPLPVSVTAPAPRAGRPPCRSEVAVLGFIYPGKGHREAIEAAVGVRGPAGEAPAVVALGTPSPGHDADVDRLRIRAAELGVRFSVTGYLPDDVLLDRCRRAAVPLAAHRHLSASASITSWIAAGRRPLVADSPYAREIDALRPGTIRRYDPGALPAALAQALVEPDSTWLAGDAVLRPDLQDVVDAYVEWWTTRVRW